MSRLRTAGCSNSLLFRGLLQQETDSRIQTTFSGFWDNLPLHKRTGHVCFLSLVLLEIFQQHMSNSSEAKGLQREHWLHPWQSTTYSWGYISQVHWRSNVNIFTQEGKTAYEKRVPSHTVYNLPFQHPKKMVHAPKKYTVPYHIWIPSKKG